MADQIWINAGPVFARAKAAYERTNTGSSDRESGQMDALDAIVFAAASLEAFMNEAVALASQEWPPSKPPEPDSVQIFATLVDDIENRHGSVTDKFLKASEVFTGQPYNKGTHPYQNFALLMRLRDALLHLKPRDEMITDTRGWWVTQTPQIIQQLRSENITSEYNDATSAPLLLHISTRAVARWACNTAADMVQSALEMAPESRFKSQLIQCYASHIKPL